MSRIPFLGTLAVLAFAIAPSHAAEPAADAPAAKPYPRDTCIVTDEKLGSMGDPVVKVYDGQEVKFCCQGCVKGFEKDQATYLAKLTAPKAADPAAPAGGTEKPAPADKAKAPAAGHDHQHDGHDHHGHGH